MKAADLAPLFNVLLILLGYALRRLLDLAFVLVVVAALFTAIGFFYGTGVPWMQAALAPALASTR